MTMPRFLSSQGDIWLYKNALTYALTAKGIPIVYYGTEQSFRGGNDPFNRETLWSSGYNTNSEMYLYLKTVIAYRKQHKIGPMSQITTFIDDQFYSYYRSNSSLIILTNVGCCSGDVSRTIASHPFRVGTRLCNIFWPKDDCMTVSGSTLSIKLLHGEPKIYVVS